MKSLSDAINWWRDESGVSLAAHGPILAVIAILIFMAFSQKFRGDVKAPLLLFCLYFFVTVALWSYVFFFSGSIYVAMVVTVLLHLLPWPMFILVMVLFLQSHGKAVQGANSGK